MSNPITSQASQDLDYDPKAVAESLYMISNNTDEFISRNRTSQKTWFLYLTFYLQWVYNHPKLNNLKCT